MKVLVTGATGFVGTWLTKKLLDRGHSVRILSRSGRADFPFNSSSIEVFKGDVAHLQSTLEATKNIDAVFHLAGVVGYSRAMRQQMVETNVIGTQNVVEACHKNKVKRLIYMSSVVAIGAGFNDKTVLNEEADFNLHHLDLGYFETKWKAEQIVKEAVKSGLIEAVILNPSTIYGPGDAKKGSRSTQVKVAQGKFPFYTSGGVNVVHIDDVVDATYNALTMGRSGERYILCGENIRIKKLFELIAASAGVNSPAIYLPNFVIFALGKLGDYLEKQGKKGPINSENAWASVLFHWFDSSKAQKELGFKVRPAREAITQSVRWMKEHQII